MSYLLIFIGLVFFIKLISNSNKKDPKPLYDVISKPYFSITPLTKTETIFYHRLVEANPDHIVLSQVQLSSFIKVDKSKIPRNKLNKWQNSISQQSVDYLICTKEFSIISAIELDDKTHLSSDAIKRDNKKMLTLRRQV